MTRLRLVADDLTGALDSAAQFTGSHGAIAVLLRQDFGETPDSFALDLNCRDSAESEAVARTRATAGRLAGPGIAFKKIDSLLRGHWAAELAALASVALFARIILAPAFPAQGRITRQGRQYRGNPDGRWIMLPAEPAADLARRGVEVRSGLDEAATGRPCPVLLCDGESDDDLAAVARRGQKLLGPTLWCGSAGLARALAAVPPARAGPSDTPHLVVVGSNHAVTREQVGAVLAAGTVDVIRFGADAAISADRVNQALAGGRPCLALADLPAVIGAGEAAELIARRLDAMLPRVTRPATLTVVGGETFAAVCRALGAQSLDVVGEWRPGVPACRMMGGRWAGTACYSKSGAFGAAGTLVDLLG